MLHSLFNRYVVVVVWHTPAGISSQQFRVFGRQAALNYANGLARMAESRFCAIAVFGPHGGLV